MDDSAILRIEASFSNLLPRSQELIERFYAKLFATHPSLRPLFPNDLTDQKGKLLQALVLIVRNFRAPDVLHSRLVELGRRHQGYGAKPEHFPAFRDTLVGVMAEMLGSQWNPQLTSDWRTAIDYVGAIMLEGHPVAPSAPHHAH